jgi:glycosyltransferase involved in cell wall biosynthesis
MAATTDILFVLPELSQTVGGVHAAIDLCRALQQRSLRAQCLVLGTMTPAVREGFKESLPDGALLHSQHWLRFVMETQARPRIVVSTLFATSLPAALFAWRHGLSHIHFVQGNEFLFQNGLVHRQVEDAYSFADTLICTSPWLRESIQRHAPEKETALLPLGIDLQRCKRAERPSNARARIGMVLRSGPDKGQAVLLETLQLLGAHTGRIALTLLLSPGYDCPEPWSALADTIVERLPLDRDGVARHLRQCDLFVDASLHEGFGLFPLEAMACGAVPVVSDSGGVRQYCGEANSVVIAAVNQPAAYADGLLALANDADRRGRMRDAGFATVQRFDQNAAFERYAAYFRERLAALPADFSPRPERIEALRTNPPVRAAETRDALKLYFSLLAGETSLDAISPLEPEHKKARGYGAYSALKTLLPRRLRRALYFLIVNPPD